MPLDKLLKSLLAGASLTALFAAAPLTVDLGGGKLMPLVAAYALADGGDGGEDGDDSGHGDDDEDEDDDDEDDEDDDEEDDDDHDDDDEDDDHDHDEDDDDNSGRDEPRVPGGSGCDDPEDLLEHPECDPDGTGIGVDEDDDGWTEYRLPDGTKVEISPDGTDIEVKYPDGSKEEIRDGLYERKDSGNRTVEERPATADDYARIQAVLNG